MFGGKGAFLREISLIRSHFLLGATSQMDHVTYPLKFGYKNLEKMSDTYKNLKRFGFATLMFHKWDRGLCQSAQAAFHAQDITRLCLAKTIHPPQKRAGHMAKKCQELCTLARVFCTVFEEKEDKSQLVVSRFNLSSQRTCPHLGKALLKPFKDSIGFMPRFNCLNHLSSLSVNLAA